MKENIMLMKPTLIVLLSSLLCIFSLQAQTAGELDSLFGNQGVVISDISGADDFVYDAVLQPDGKIVVAGYTNLLNDVLLLRYNSDGSPDNSFGTNGIVITDAGTDFDWALAIALQSDGKIVVAGGTDSTGDDGDVLVIRYNADGTIDNLFGNAGIFRLHVGELDDAALTICIQTDGKIIIGGLTDSQTFDYNWFVARLTPEGIPDTGFGINGLSSFDLGGTDAALACAVQNDNKILLTGYSDASGSFNLATVRFNPDGSFDNTFSSDGIVTTSINTSTDWAEAIAVQQDSRIVVAGLSYINSSYDVALVRYLNNGDLDASFGSNGVATTSFSSGNDEAFTMQIQPNGKILIGGITSAGVGASDFLVARFNSNGTPDESFGNNGSTAIDLNEFDIGWALLIQSDDKIILAGTTDSGSNTDVVLLRLFNDEEIGIDEADNSFPLSIFPNPVNGREISISFNFPMHDPISISLINLDGKRLSVLENDFIVEGNQKTRYVLPESICSGIYLLNVESPRESYVYKVVVTD